MPKARAARPSRRCRCGQGNPGVAVLESAVLIYMQRGGIGSVEDLNKIVLRAHGVPSSPRPMLHAWPLPATTWRDDVTTQLKQRRTAPDFTDEMLP